MLAVGSNSGQQAGSDGVLQASLTTGTQFAACGGGYLPMGTKWVLVGLASQSHRVVSRFQVCRC